MEEPVGNNTVKSQQKNQGRKEAIHSKREWGHNRKWKESEEIQSKGEEEFEYVIMILYSYKFKIDLEEDVWEDSF
jgi:transcription initiation factor TFIIIB Brf1 subunit/transcription initiation factor TFIIB